MPTTIRVPTQEEISLALKETGGDMTTVFCAGCSQVVKFIPKYPGKPGSTYGWCSACAPPLDKAPEPVVT